MPLDVTLHPPSPQNCYLVEHAARLLASYRYWTGKDLVDGALAPVDFGVVNPTGTNTSVRTFTLRNDGTANLSITLPFGKTGANQAEFAVNTTTGVWNLVEARKVLEELNSLAKRRYISPGTLAELYGALGETDRAFALIEKALEERDNMVILLKVDPLFDQLRKDSRFDGLLRRVGFP